MIITLSVAWFDGSLFVGSRDDGKAGYLTKWNASVSKFQMQKSPEQRTPDPMEASVRMINGGPEEVEKRYGSDPVSL